MYAATRTDERLFPQALVAPAAGLGQGLLAQPIARPEPSLKARRRSVLSNFLHVDARSTSRWLGLVPRLGVTTKIQPQLRP